MAKAEGKRRAAKDRTQRRLAEPFESFNERIAASRAESRTLTALRDALLPRLLSGEIDVSAATRLVERSA